MQKSQRDQWKHFIPVLYDYMSICKLPDYSIINQTKFISPLQKQSSSYYSESLASTITHIEHCPQVKVHPIMDQYQSQMQIILIQLSIPLTKLDDPRLKPNIKIISQIPFQYQIHQIEEISVPKSLQSKQDILLVFNDCSNPYVYIYSLAQLQKYNQKQQKSQPRARLTAGQGSISCINLRKSHRQKDLLVGNMKGQIMLFDLQKPNTPQKYLYHRQSIIDCSFLTYNQRQQKQQKTFISSSLDGFVFLWDRRTQKPGLKIQANQSLISKLLMIEDWRFLTGGHDGSIKFWDIRSNLNRFWNFKQHKGPVTYMTKLNVPQNQQRYHNYLFASGSAQGDVIMWQQQAEFCHFGHKSPVSCISYYPKDDLFISTQMKSPQIQIWKAYNTIPS